MSTKKELELHKRRSEASKKGHITRKANAEAKRLEDQKLLNKQHGISKNPPPAQTQVETQAETEAKPAEKRSRGWIWILLIFVILFILFCCVPFWMKIFGVPLRAPVAQPTTVVVYQPTGTPIGCPGTVATPDLCPAKTEAAPATPMPPTATPVPTATSAPKCTGYTMLQKTDFGHKPRDPIFKNMDVGDNQLIAVVQAWDRSDPKTAFIAIIDQSYNLDFERDTIAGTYWYFTGERTAVYCRANEMWSEMGGTAYRLYVGNHEAPTGWSTDFPSAWTMKTWVFTDTTIVVDSAVWNPVTIQISSDHVHGSANWTYGQLWDGIHAGKVYHFIVAPNWKITSPKYQGTVWTISGITSLTTDTLILRFAQMTSEVELRDDHPTVFKYYCGPGTAPTGWSSTMPTGWTCTK